MDEYFGLYAVQSGSLDHVAKQLAKVLPLTFVAHDSDYWDSYLLHGDALTEHVQVYLNNDPMWRAGDPADERFFEPEYPNHGVLVAVRLSSECILAVHSCLASTFPDSCELSRAAVSDQRLVNPRMDADGSDDSA
jgi:hypothetical protein